MPHLQGTQLTTGQWYHVAATMSGSTTSIYLNGELERELFPPTDVRSLGRKHGGERQPAACQKNIGNTLKSAIAASRIIGYAAHNKTLLGFDCKPNQGGLNLYSQGRPKNQDQSPLASNL